MGLDVLGVALLALLIGAAFCFFGFRFFLFLLPVWGFFMGFLAGAQGMAALFGDGFLVQVTGWVVGFGLGVVLAILSYLFYWIAVVLLGGSIGYAIGVGLMGALNIQLDLLVVAAGVAVGVFGSLVVVFFQLPRYLVIVLTAAGGSTSIVAGVLLLLGTVKLDGLSHGIVGAAIGVIQDNLLWAVVWVALLAVGVFFQVRSTVRMEAQIGAERYRYG
jgi:hypothetical protein